MKRQIIVVADGFSATQLEDIQAAVEDWATVESFALDETRSPRVVQRMKEAEVMFGLPSPHDLAASSLRYLQLQSIGYDIYTSAGVTFPAGLTICNAAGVMDIGMSEHLLSLMLALARRLPDYYAARQTRVWRRGELTHGELSGSTVCFIGVGQSGTAMARSCLGLGMRVRGVRRHPDRPHPLIDEIYGPDQLYEAVREADHVVAILPASHESKHLFNAAFFEAMRPGAYFYNLGRGMLVDEAALIQYLQSGHLAGAGLDVFETEPLPADSPLWTMENVIVTPHVAGFSINDFKRYTELFIENLRRYRDGSPLKNAVLVA